MRGLSLGRLAPMITMGLLAVAAILVQLSPAPGDAERLAEERTRSDAVTASGPQPASPASETGPVAAVRPLADSAIARRGTLEESVTMNGRIGAVEESMLSFRSPQRISQVLVQPGDLVDAGKVLVKADERELARSLMGARDRATAAEVKFSQAQSVAAAQQQRQEHREELTRMRGQRAVSTA
jgi:hypothetical protein